jgi:plasmid stability protein
MMPDFLIRGLEETTMSHLKERAAKNGRSLQEEIKDTLRRSTKMTREETIATMLRFQEETKDRGIGDSTPLIREDRDSR